MKEHSSTEIADTTDNTKQLCSYDVTKQQFLEVVLSVIIGLGLVFVPPQLPQFWERALGWTWTVLAAIAALVWLLKMSITSISVKSAVLLNALKAKNILNNTDPSPISAWVRLIGRACAVAGVAWCACIHMPIGVWLARPLLLPHATGSADAIVVLAAGLGDGGQHSFSGLQRILHGVALWREGRAPLLILSASEHDDRGFDDRAATASLAAFLELPSDRCIIIHKGIRTTRTEALVIGNYLKSLGLKRILLVTNGAHIYRASLVFSANGLEVLPAPVQDQNTIESANENRLLLTNAAIHEWVGLFWYWLRGYITF